jgi:hypothetical protein
LFPRRDHSSAIRLRLALIATAAIVVGLWQIWQRATLPPPPSETAAPLAPAPPKTTPPATTPPGTTPSSSAAASTPATPRSIPTLSAAETRDLGIDEARGGHTLARHVGRTDAQLLERLEHERNISAASTYTDRAVAERTVARTLARNEARLSAWRARRGTRPNLALDYRGPANETIGRSIRRGRRDAAPCTNAIVVLRWDGRGDFVLTSYPEAAR